MLADAIRGAVAPKSELIEEAVMSEEDDRGDDADVEREDEVARGEVGDDDSCGGGEDLGEDGPDRYGFAIGERRRGARVVCSRLVGR